MKAAVVQQLGRPPVYADVGDPEPHDGQVVADVRAVAVKNIERSLVAGTHYGSGHLMVPGLIGTDAVMVLPDGRRVYGGATPPAGTMAERIAVDPGMVLDLPDSIDDAAAAALPNAAVSAWFSLEHAGQVEPGQCVLVLGGTGVTGSLAVQLAKRRFGVDRVVVVGRNTDRLTWLSAHGADEVVGLGERPLEQEIRRLHAERSFDLVLDYLWSTPAEQTLRAMANDDLAAGFHPTRFVQVGAMAGPTIELPSGVLRSAGIEIVGQGAGSVPKEAFARVGTEILPALFTLLGRGEISVETTRRPLADVTDAWTAPVPSGVRVVLTP